MLRVRAAPGHARFFWAAVFALTLAMRLLTPNGFMPAFDQGRITIVDCPESSPVPMPPMRGMGHDHGKDCEACPHAIATGAGLADPASLYLGAPAFAMIAPLVWHELVFNAATIKHERPPAIGPPPPARFIYRPN